MRGVLCKAAHGTTFFMISVFALGADTPEWRQKQEAGRKAFEQGHYTQAEALGRTALELLERAGSGGGTEAASCLNDLGGVNAALGKSAEAEGQYRKAL